MVPYHGTPITPEEAALAALRGGAAFVSYPNRQQLPLVVAVCKQFAIDNGAYPAWAAGTPVADWSPFYAWAEECRRIPSCDFAVIPDVIDGDEAANDALLAEWPLPHGFGAPVWHMHESLGRLAHLATRWPRICIGSSGEFATVGSQAWWGRNVFSAIADTVAFSALAFVLLSPTPKPLEVVAQIAGLQLLAKLLGGTFWAFAINRWLRD